MFTGGISPFAYTSFPGANLLQNGGVNSQSLPGVQSLTKNNGNGNSSWNSFFGGSDPSNPDLMGMVKTMLGPLLQQYGISIPGVTPDGSSGNGNDNSGNNEDDAAKKWKATLQAGIRVQDNVEAVKVSPPDDSGYYSSLSCYSDS
jgi:hypothetical protein